MMKASVKANTLEIVSNNQIKKDNSKNLTKSLTLNSMKMKNFELKLIDFGCAKIFSKYKYSLS